MASFYFEDGKRYEDFSTAVQTTVSVKTTITSVLAASDKRQWARITNMSDTAIILSLQNSTASITTNLGIRLEPLGSDAGTTFEISREKQGGVYTGAIYADAPATAKTLSVVYFNRTAG